MPEAPGAEAWKDTPPALRTPAGQHLAPGLRPQDCAALCPAAPANPDSFCAFFFFLTPLLYTCLDILHTHVFPALFVVILSSN